jgi:hypothetical protein
MAGLAGGYGGPAVGLSVETPRLSQLLSRIHDATNRIGDLRQNTSVIADRVCGSAPPSALANGIDGPKDPAMLTMLFLAVDMLQGRISEAESELQRLSVL